MGPQSSIGHYRITAKLGEGGMGEVWRATDTKLNREVAIKTLPDAFAQDADRMARFTQEAQVLASLNHPNIAVIYGVEDQALVMELVQGPTLEERIAAGPVPLEEALGVACQIAEALEAAHEKGVIHRDLKPANVKVTPEGVVKVLDFGLAKVAEPVAGATSANSPTLTIRATQAGLIMGTAAYMAPEQAAGKPVDRRADIWSFGVVLYEMLTGKTLFTGETVSHTLASVLKDPIDFDVAQAVPAIRRLLARCLTRNPKDRLRDIGEARIAIRGYLANPSAEAARAVPLAGASQPYRAMLPWIVCAALILALAAALAWIFKPSQPRPITRFLFTFGAGQSITTPNRLVLAISPDGTKMVYSANRQLYLREMAELEARPIPGTRAENTVTNPVFSPDGKSVAFFSNSATSATVKRIAISGGAASTLSPASVQMGMSWGDEGIIFALYEKGILRVSPNGGQPETLIPATGSELMGDPQLLPGGEVILFTVGQYRAGLQLSNKWRIVARNLKTGTQKTLVQDATGARYLPTCHLVYWKEGVLFAAPFNLRRMEITGSSVSVVEGVRSALGVAQFAYSSTGTLVYIPGAVTAAGRFALARVDRKGDIEPLKAPPAAYAFPRVSKDGKRVAYQIEDAAESSIWVWELAGGTAPRRLTLPGTGANQYPIWSPDGQRIAFQSDREGDHGIWWQRADGSGTAEHITTPAKEVLHIPDSWSADGQTISFTEEKTRTSEVWTWSLRDKKATVFASTPGALLGRSVFSPDGHWIAYQLNAQPASRVYVRPFPPTETVYVAPQDGDTHHPAWSPDGKELFYVAGGSLAGSMSFSTRPSVSFGSPVRLPQSGFVTAAPGGVRTFDVLPDGQHFIGVVPAGETDLSAGPPQIHVVLNWFDDVRQRAPLK